MRKPIWVFQGPNLNLLGEREMQIYGTMSLKALQQELDKFAEPLNLALHHIQSNHEGTIIDKMQEVRFEAAGALLNSAGLSHTSIALHDAIKAVNYPVVEIHLSDTSKRELFRKQSFITAPAVATFKGEGIESYKKGLQFLADYLEGKNPQAPTEPNPNLLFRKSETIHLDDTDAATILFNANLFRICHRAYEEWMAQIGFPLGQIIDEKKWGLPVVKLEGEFLKPLRTDMEIIVEIELLRLGERSFTLGYRITDTACKIYATASSVHVATDAIGGKADFPDAFREILLKM